MAKLKGYKTNYKTAWKHSLMMTVPPVLSLPAGERLRKLRDAIRREHHLNRHGAVK